MNERNEHRVRLHTYSPTHITDLSTLMQYDRWTQQSIDDAEALIQKAKEYRLQLVKRVQELQRMRFHIRTTLQREKNTWTGKIRYFLKTEKVYEDGTAETLDESIFEGKDRYKAIAEFKAIQKKFPGYEFVKHIEKGKWER